MALAQLQLLVKVQQEKEDKMQAQYRSALHNYQSMQQKYQGLANYRIEYVQQTQSRGQEGMASRHFNQYLNFIGKLDRFINITPFGKRECESAIERITSSSCINSFNFSCRVKFCFTIYEQRTF